MMAVEIDIRPADRGDAEEISQVIVSALRQTSAGDYAPDIIDRLVKGFDPPAIEAFVGKRSVYIAIVAGRIVGTASLETGSVRTVFVAPDMQGLGVGRQLLQEIEKHARIARLSALNVQSSISAEPFYARLGFTAVGDSYYGDERTIRMQRALT